MKSILSLKGIIPQLLGCTAHILVTITSLLFWMLNRQIYPSVAIQQQIQYIRSWAVQIQAIV